ncbi:MAG: Hsp70 family protein, partial [Leuconostoc mesenteroides]
AKDLGTQKEQKITIQAAGGLSDEEIEKMMNDAKANEEADAKKKEAVDTRNEADQLIFQTEKTLEEVGDKLGDDEKKPTQDALEALKKAKEDAAADDADLTDLKAKSEELTKVAGELAMKLYQQAAPKDGAEGDAKSADDNTVDGDFEEVDPNKDDKK